jgi:hypothetical protein
MNCLHKIAKAGSRHLLARGNILTCRDLPSMRKQNNVKHHKFRLVHISTYLQGVIS